MKEGKFVLSWTTLLIAIPVGCAGAMVTLGFRHTIEWLNRLLFGTTDDITQAMHVWPWFLWPVIVGAGGVVAGFFLRYAVALKNKESVPITWRFSMPGWTRYRPGLHYFAPFLQ